MAEEKIVVLLPAAEEFRIQMQEIMPDAHFIWAADGGVLPQDWQNATVIVGNPNRKQLAQCSSLRWLQLGSAGAEDYCVPGVLPEDTMLTNATGCYGHAISEHMLGLTLMLMKKLHLYRDQQSTGYWQSKGTVPSITSLRILVVGLGDIGSNYARRMKALGAAVVGITRTPHTKPDYVDEIATVDQLDCFLPDADVVALSVPGGDKTTKLMNRQRLAMMKPGAFLINVGRGSAVDTEALYDALWADQLGGAALDVTDPEPLPPDHPLWRMPQAIITPHISGGFQMRETYEAVMGVCIQNLKAYAAGKPLTHQVDRNTGYMKKS